MSACNRTGPSGSADGQISWSAIGDFAVVQPYCQNISVFPNAQIGLYLSHPAPPKGRFAVVTNAARDAMDVECA
jgi:hypothetical protein